MRHSLKIYVCAATLMALAVVSRAAEIHIYIVPKDINIQPEVINITSSETETLSKNTEGNLVAAIEFDKHEIRKPILIKFSSTLPDTYKFKDFQMDMPFTEKDTVIEIPLAPTKITGSAKDVRRLFDRNVKEHITDDELPKFYQEVRAAALSRMQRLNEKWRRLSSKDVQIVFLYLTTVRELNERIFIVPPDDINDALLWMKLAISNNKSVVDKTVSILAARQAISQVEESEGLRYGILWNAIVGMRLDCNRKYHLLLEYKNSLFKLPKHRAKKVFKSTGVYKGNVLMGLAQCVSFNIRCVPSSVENPINEINHLIDELEIERSTTQTDLELYREIESSISSLIGLRIDLERGNPMRCPGMGGNSA